MFRNTPTLSTLCSSLTVTRLERVRKCERVDHGTRYVLFITGLLCWVIFGMLADSIQAASPTPAAEGTAPPAADKPAVKPRRPMFVPVTGPTIRRGPVLIGPTIDESPDNASTEPQQSNTPEAPPAVNPSPPQSPSKKIPTEQEAEPNGSLFKNWSPGRRSRATPEPSRRGIDAAPPRNRSTAPARDDAKAPDDAVWTTPPLTVPTTPRPSSASKFPSVGPSLTTPAQIGAPQPGPVIGPGVPVGPQGPVPLLDPANPSFVTPAPAMPASSFHLHLVMHEELINRFIVEQRIDDAPVVDQFEDTQIYGQQRTVSSVRVDLLPSADQLRMALVLNGCIASDTDGYSPQQIVVHSRGNHYFQSRKEIAFNGNEFLTRGPTLFVDPHTVNTNALTPLTGTPILGGVAEGLVLHFAETKRDASDAFTRQRVAEKLKPQFNREIDQKLAEGNGLFAKFVRDPLRALRLEPTRQQFRTTHEHLHYAAAYDPPRPDRDYDGNSSTPPSTGAIPDVPPPSPSVLEPHAASLYLHESYLNALVDRLNLRGQRVTDRQLKAMLKRFFPTRDDDPRPPLPGLPSDLVTDILFDPVKPLEFDVVDDKLLMLVRADFRPGGDALLPPLEVRIPYQLVRRGDRWEMDNTGVTVKLMGSGRDSNQPRIEQLVQNAVQNSLPKISFPAQLPAALWKKSTPAPQLTSVKVSQGWLIFNID